MAYTHTGLQDRSARSVLRYQRLMARNQRFATEAARGHPGFDVARTSAYRAFT
jgi:hypothetical protein